MGGYPGENGARGIWGWLVGGLTEVYSRFGAGETEERFAGVVVAFFAD